MLHNNFEKKKYQILFILEYRTAFRDLYNKRFIKGRLGSKGRWRYIRHYRESTQTIRYFSFKNHDTYNTKG